MVDINKNTHERNGVCTIVNNDGILWLNEKHVEEGLDHKNVREISTKHHSKTNQQNFYIQRISSQSNRGFVEQQLHIEQSVLTKINWVHLKKTTCKHNIIS